MSDVATPPAAAPAAAAPVAAPPAAPAPPAAAPASESLLPPLTPAPAAAPAPGEAPAWAQKVPEKFHVKGADGKVDIEATLLKQADSYTNLEKVKGPTPPAAPSDYTFTPPEDMKDLQFDDALSAGFRERAHKAGLSQAQYEMVMGEYIGLVPQVLDSVVKASAEEAKAELSKVWQSPAVFEAQINNVMRSISASGLSEQQQQDVHARFGRDPLFLQFAAAMGNGMREDKAPLNPDGGAGTPQTLEQIQGHPAYRDPKHPEHAAYSARAMAIAQKITPP